MGYISLTEIEKDIRIKKCEYWEIILQDDMKERMVSAENSLKEMQGMYQAMKQADKSYEGRRKSSSGLAGTDGLKIEKANKKGKIISGEFMGHVMERAVKMGESNACMKRIVAAPTAGSCGVIPAVLLSYEKDFKMSETRMIEALYVAAGIGCVIAKRASISGAEGGCQAEIGSASAMAAGALCYLRGGTPAQIHNASAIALKNLLGLVCDPVAGLVEVPCVKRNVIGAVNAVTASDLSMAGVKSVIPADEVIDAMKNIGRMLPCALKETAEGGLASTPTGQKIAKRLSGK